MNSPFYFEQSVRHYQEELRRNERRAQHLAELRLLREDPGARVERVDSLIARIPRLRRARRAREATA
ncbi:MAG TPA: hypothetical protein VMT59_00250 [Gaiellaceae bacterium]|nr:hypothetical protein [Gaiellaceae bacterium]